MTEMLLAEAGYAVIVFPLALGCTTRRRGDRHDVPDRRFQCHRRMDLGRKPDFGYWGIPSFRFDWNDLNNTSIRIKYLPLFAVP